MNKLKAGDSMPPISTTDILGNKLDLDTYEGKAWEGKTLLTFMRNVDCVFCNVQIHKLLQKQSDFEKAGIRILIFMQSPKEDMLEEIHKEGFPYTLIADPGKQFYSQIGSESSWLKYFKVAGLMGAALKAQMKGFNVKLLQRGEQHLMPADFVIDQNRLVLRAHYGQHVADHLPMDTIFSA